MSMLCGLDLHRGQITFDGLVLESGEVWRGRIASPDRARLRRWLSRDLAARSGGGRVDISVEGCTGWRYVVEEITAAGYAAHLAEPADTQAARGPKRRAKTDRSDCRLQRLLLAKGELPESWIPPTVVLEWRERSRLYKSLIDQRRVWVQRIHAELFHHGVALPEGNIRSEAVRAWAHSDTLELSPAARQRIETGYRMIDSTQAEITPLRRQFIAFAAHQPACRLLVQTYFGVGPLTAVVAWSELGDCQRFGRSEQAVRHSGLDVSVNQSDLHRAGGHLVREGPATLRWALYESAKCAARANSPDHNYYQQVKDGHGGKIATISVARKLARRCYHTLKAVDPELIYATG
jgi:transposase